MSIKNFFSITQLNALDKEFNKINSKIKMLENNIEKNSAIIQANVETTLNECKENMIDLDSRLKKIKLLAIVCICLNIIQLGVLIYERI